MLYIIYLVGVILLLMNGIGADHFFTNYVDGYTLMFVLLPCVLILFCTKSFQAFGRSFLFVIGKKEDVSPTSYKESSQAVKMVMITAVIFGSIGFLAGMVNGIHSLNFSSSDAYGWALLNASAAMLSLFYPLLICVILLPVWFLLKKHMVK